MIKVLLINQEIINTNKEKNYRFKKDKKFNKSWVNVHLSQKLINKWIIVVNNLNKKRNNKKIKI